LKPENVSSTFSKNKNAKAFYVFGMLPPSMSRRESPAAYLRQLLKEKFGDNYVLKASDKAKRMRLKLPVTTIRDLIDERHARGPSVATLKTVAAVLDVDSLEFVSRWLDRPIETEGYSESQFAALWRSYRTLKKEKQERIDGYIRMMINEMDRED
jgi:hypothetical protein